MNSKVTALHIFCTYEVHVTLKLNSKLNSWTTFCPTLQYILYFITDFFQHLEVHIMQLHIRNRIGWGKCNLCRKHRIYMTWGWRMHCFAYRWWCIARGGDSCCRVRGGVESGLMGMGGGWRGKLKWTGGWWGVWGRRESMDRRGLRVQKATRNCRWGVYVVRGIYDSWKIIRCWSVA